MDRPVGTWELRLEVGTATAGLPAFLAIARTIATDVRNGRLKAGARLPSSRELSASLGVHRNTVLAAFRELEAEGFLCTEAGRGTFVADAVPDVKPAKGQRVPGAKGGRAARPLFSFTPPGAAPLYTPPPPGALPLYAGMPDTRLLPKEALARAYRRALRGKVDLLGYADPRGEPSLREAVAQMLRLRRGLAVEADDVMITRGSQMALALIGRAVVRPGDVVAVEALGYQPAWRALTNQGAVLLPVPVDAEGLDVAALEAACEREPVRAVYVTPHHQFPTTVTMSAARRMALLEVARRRKLAIVEDDYDHEFHYDGRPVLPLASADDGSVVLYVGTLSKVLAPALRVGFLVAPAPVLEAALALRSDLDRQGDRVGEHALSELMEDGEVQRHIWRAHRIYQERREHCVHELRRQLRDTVDFVVPPGGLGLWTTVHRDVPVAAWHREAAERGVLFQPGGLFTMAQRDTQHARIGYCGLTERELTTAITRLAQAAHAVRERTRRSKAQ
jgi:GntR family transcriptional regulator/MocR family aminotransferase